MSATPAAVPAVFPAGPLEAEPLTSLDASLARLVKSVKNACGTIDRLHTQRDELRSALVDLLEQVEQLDGYELTRDLEPYKAEANWDDALHRARTVLRLTA